MALTRNLLMTAAIAGALTALPVAASAALDGHTTSEKAGCGGKDSCSGKDKDSCGGKDKSKDACSGKDGCGGQSK